MKHIQSKVNEPTLAFLERRKNNIQSMNKKKK